MSRLKIIFASLLAVLLLASACDSTNDGGGQTKESKGQQSNYDRLVAKDPAHSMAVSQTRKNINKWIDRWGKDPNKLSYVYLQSGTQLIGYFVFKGLPVSYCTALTPTYKLIDPGGSSDNGNIAVPAPSVDGVYYSGSGCNTYYGFDATTDAYVEYTVGTSQNVLIYDKPLTQHPNVPNLAPK